MATLVADDLMQALHATTSQCQITIVNACPPEWGVVIDSAGVKFFYRDGTDTTDGPRSVGLHAGQSATFMSSNGDKCVFQFFAAMNVSVPNEGSQTLTTQDGVGDGQCLLHETVTLGPQAVTNEKQLRGESRRLELKRSR